MYDRNANQGMPFRGCVNGLLIVAPFWIIGGLLFWWLIKS
jgi:hypothetical protein